jgi:hypothetical protein
MLTRASLIGLTVLLAGCASDASTRVVRVPVVPFAGINSDIHEANECSNAGGWWTEAGEGRDACVMLATDSGKECSDDTECQAFCAAEVGTPDGVATKGKCAIDMRSRCRMQHVLGGHARIECIE